MPPAMRTATSVRSGRNPHASGASRPVFHAKQFLRQSLFLVHPDGNVFRKHLDRVVNIEEVLGAVFIHAVFMNEDSLCEKTGGVREFCTFRFGENGYPFSLPNCTFHGGIIRISM